MIDHGDLSRFLPPPVYGAVALGMACAMLCAIPAALALQALVTRPAPRSLQSARCNGCTAPSSRCDECSELNAARARRFGKRRGA